MTTPTTTIRALLRREKLKRAIAKTRKTVVMPWVEPVRDILPGGMLKTAPEVVTPDAELVALLNLAPKQRMVSRRLDNGRRVTVPENVVVFPPWFSRNPGTDGKPGRNLLFRVLDYTIAFSGDPLRGTYSFLTDADEVVETVLPDGRVVYVHSLLHRLLHRLWIQTVTPIAESVLSGHVHAYRPEMSRFSAFLDARNLVRHGFQYAVDFDIKSYFQSITVELVDLALRAELPQLDRRLRNFGLWLLRPKGVLRRPTHPGRLAGTAKLRSDAPGHLLTGGPIQPLLANIVGHYVLDRPWARWMGDRAVLLRYSDNGLILARTPSAAEEGLAAAAAFLLRADLHLHPEKGEWNPVDIHQRAFSWLGKTLIGNNVRTPEENLTGWADELLDIDPGTAEFSNFANYILSEVVLDHADRVEFVRRHLKRRSPLHLHGFDQILAAHVRRTPVLPPDPEPDGDLYNQPATNTAATKKGDVSNETAVAA